MLFAVIAGVSSGIFMWGVWMAWWAVAHVGISLLLVYRPDLEWMWYWVRTFSGYAELYNTCGHRRAFHNLQWEYVTSGWDQVGQFVNLGLCHVFHHEHWSPALSVLRFHLFFYRYGWILLGCWIVAVIITALLVLRWFVGRAPRAIQQHAGSYPFKLKEVRAFFDARLSNFRILGESACAGIRSEREFLSGVSYKFLKHVYPRIKIRELGSAMRAGKAGSHSCNVESCTDDFEAQHNPLNLLDMDPHSLYECPLKNNPATMAYADFKMALTDLADNIRAPLLLTTYDFTPGPLNFYNGEMTGYCTDSHVFAETRDGDVLAERYHGWKNEGFIMGERHVLRYHRVAKLGHSVVYLLLPARGSFSPWMPNRLRDNPDKSLCVDGAICSKVANKWSIHLRGKLLGTLDNSAVERSAFCMFLHDRDDKFSMNLGAMVRTRMTADKQNQDLLRYSFGIASALADDMALSLGHINSALGPNVKGMPWHARVWYGLKLRSARAMARVVPTITPHLLSWVYGSSKHHSRCPWLWRETDVATYEVHAEQTSTEDTELSEQRSQPTPFREEGAAYTAPIDGEFQCRSEHHERERGGLDGAAGAEPRALRPPQPTPDPGRRFLPNTARGLQTPTRGGRQNRRHSRRSEATPSGSFSGRSCGSWRSEGEPPFPISAWKSASFSEATEKSVADRADAPTI